MNAQKESVSLEEEAVAVARQAAEAAGMTLSAWLSRAARDAARIEEGLRAVSEWEADHGPITEDEDSRARDVLVDACLIDH